MRGLWIDLIEATKPFMSVQYSAKHFEFFGLDFLADCEQNVWLLEVNRIPGLANSCAESQAEEVFFGRLVHDLVHLTVFSKWEEEGKSENGFVQTTEASDGVVMDKNMRWKNIANFLAHCK
eukprot:CAMPEP_0171464092 /NCGR_PEP_ID=MMETSP0945-20130129/7520_1 /TAXON_ID=109269 /ORGANISM="Vaucheria litorea, Strain CCMP2940" /LENGTH=120 /DNA_ID=CAMNT_0011991053 /DNA_START=588 /DNA_END=947 /DNA_ORIENTATION=+